MTKNNMNKEIIVQALATFCHISEEEMQEIFNKSKTGNNEDDVRYNIQLMIDDMPEYLTSLEAQFAKLWVTHDKSTCFGDIVASEITFSCDDLKAAADVAIDYYFHRRNGDGLTYAK